jgi:uncharacterized protein (DUF885 family)
MHRIVAAMVAGILPWAAAAEQAPWIETSNTYTRQLLDVQLQHSPERGSQEGAAQYRAPGQANSYFYGYSRLLSLRKETEKALGAKFNQKKFHDFILSQGLLPPELMRKAVLEEFVPANR